MTKKKVILVIRDGWGFRADSENNAIAHAKTPNNDFLVENYPNVLLNASGKAVGLPKNYQGNSEVGHLTIGAGRILSQAIEHINQAIKDNSFFSNSSFLKAINNCRKHNSKLHIAGLLQEEGVHSHKDHLFALLDLCKREGFSDVVLHLFTDGRDAPVTASLNHIKSVEKKLKDIGFGKIVTISGRYFAMDRDNRWDRTRIAYDCIVEGKSEIVFDDVLLSVKNSHVNHVTDEFILPRKRKDYSGFMNNDSFIFFNFRTDRTRQLTKAIVDNIFKGWFKKKINVFFVAMTKYYDNMRAEVAFSEQDINNLLGNVVSLAGLKQLRISETEKYAHVTFFFNGQNEKPYKGEKRILINSPKISTYDLLPEMSALMVTDSLINEIDKNKFDLIVVNLVNCDMVGHTGNVGAIKKAVETVDSCLGKIVKHGLNKNYTLFILADHGNAEDQRPAWLTSHTLNPVPFIVVSNDKFIRTAKLFKGKGLSDVAPTVLKILGLSVPSEMTGSSIIDFKEKKV